MKRKTTAQHAAAPTRDRECLEAVWSRGGACEACDLGGCYRQGWEKAKVTADNRRRVNGDYSGIQQPQQGV